VRLLGSYFLSACTDHVAAATTDLSLTRKPKDPLPIRQRHDLPSVAVVDLSEEMARARDGAPAIAQHLHKFVSPRG
jgi:hypothetical protein